MATTTDTTYTVRPAGCTAWAEHLTPAAAVREYKRACARISTGQILIVGEQSGRACRIEIDEDGRTHLVSAYVIQTRIANCGDIWQREASSPVYTTREAAEAAAVKLEPANGEGHQLEYQVVAE